jgi:DNA-binding winged helix-turn-helix (wHTH) protein/tetratricopeptide (TPR) repeat protein
MLYWVLLQAFCCHQRGPDTALQADLEFPPFSLDLARGALMHGDREIELRRRTWQVLLLLVRRAGQIVEKRELLEQVWGDVVVTEQTLSTSIYELRKALGDQPRAPTFIETVHGRGFRFLVVPTSAPTPSDTERGDAGSAKALADYGLIEREEPREILDAALRRAVRGERQLVFVRGEAGIGKTSLVRAFQDALPAFSVDADGQKTRLIQTDAQCVEFSGAGEPFMPVIGALRLLTRGPDARLVTPTLRRLVPPWMAELLGAGQSGRSLDEVDAESAVRTLRLLAESLEALAAESTLVIVIDDLQWCDVSTIELLNLLARRSSPARLLIVATMRPAEAANSVDVLEMMFRELVRSQLATRVDLTGLSARSVEVLIGRLLEGEPAPKLVEDLLEWTDGNPFMLGEMIDFLRVSGRLQEGDGVWRLRRDALPDAEATPPNVRAAVEARISRLSAPERAALEVAALEGTVFDVTVVSEIAERESGGLGLEEVDALCQKLCEGEEMLTVAPRLPGAANSAYAFKHALYAQALRLGVVPSRVRRIHGELAVLYEREGGVPPNVLAHHFEQAAEPARALERYAEAAEQAKLRQAQPDAIQLYRAALRCLPALADGRDRDRWEMNLRLGLGGSIFGISGYTDTEVEPLYERVRALAMGLNEPGVVMVATGGLFFAYLSSGRIESGHREAERLIEVSRALPPIFDDAARTAMGVARFCLGDLSGARAHLERPVGFEPPGGGVTSDVHIPVLRLGALATVLAHQGDLRSGAEAAGQTIEAGRSTGRNYDLANAHRQAAEYYALVGDDERAHAEASETIALAEAHGFEQIGSIGRVFLGWALARRTQAAGSVDVIRRAIEDLDRRGYRLMRSTFCARLAEAALDTDQFDEAASAVREGLVYVEASGERRHESDLWRLRAAILRRAGPADLTGAEAAAQTAIDIARDQGADLLLLRALAERARIVPSARGALHEFLVTAGPEMAGFDLGRARRLVEV